MIRLRGFWREFQVGIVRLYNEIRCDKMCVSQWLSGVDSGRRGMVLPHVTCLAAERERFERVLGGN
jgi:hypothetical protein